MSHTHTPLASFPRFTASIIHILSFFTGHAKSLRIPSDTVPPSCYMSNSVISCNLRVTGLSFSVVVGSCLVVTAALGSVEFRPSTHVPLLPESLLRRCCTVHCRCFRNVVRLRNGCWQCPCIASALCLFIRCPGPCADAVL